MDCTREAYIGGQKRVYYLSLEFLIGRLLVDSLSNLGLFEVARRRWPDWTWTSIASACWSRTRRSAMAASGGSRPASWKAWPPLAWCPMATASVMTMACSARRSSMAGSTNRPRPAGFRQPWEFERSEVKYLIGFGGSVTATTNEQGEVQHFWHWAEGVRAIAYDTPIVGWRGAGVNTLRLARGRKRTSTWRASTLAITSAPRRKRRVPRASRGCSIRPTAPRRGRSCVCARVLLRRRFAAGPLRRHLKQRGSLDSLPEYTSIQLNDTHPAIAVAELMRLLVDVHSYEWQHAWRLTTATLSYTNHTLLPEALETWPVGLMERLLPRHMQIIYLINAYHLDNLRERGIHDAELLRSVSLIEEDHGRRVRMGNLAFLGSHSTNGVSGLHTQLMRKTVFTDLHRSIRSGSTARPMASRSAAGSIRPIRS